MSKHLVIDWNTWIGKSLILFADAFATALIFGVPIYFNDPSHFLQRGSWVTFGASCGVVALKTLGAAFKDFKNYVREVDN